MVLGDRLNSSCGTVTRVRFLLTCKKTVITNWCKGTGVCLDNDTVIVVYWHYISWKWRGMPHKYTCTNIRAHTRTFSWYIKHKRTRTYKLSLTDTFATAQNGVGKKDALTCIVTEVRNGILSTASHSSYSVDMGISSLRIFLCFFVSLFLCLVLKTQLYSLKWPKTRTFPYLCPPIHDDRPAGW